MATSIIRMDVDYMSDKCTDERSIKADIKYKIKILKDFNIRLTSVKLTHLKSLKTISEIDRFTRGLIFEKLGDD